MSTRAETGGDGSFARALGRGVWIPLVMSGVAVGSAVVVSPWWVGGPVFGAWAVLEGAQLLLLRTLVRGIARNDGSAFLTNGERADLDALIRLNARARWERHRRCVSVRSACFRCSCASFRCSRCSRSSASGRRSWRSTVRRVS